MKKRMKNNMRHFTYESKYGNYEDCFFKVGRYVDNNNLAISIISETEGPICTVTVNTGNKLSDGVIAIKDYSENVGMVDWLYSLGVIESDPITKIESGFVKIPVHRLTEYGRALILGEVHEDN